MIKNISDRNIFWADGDIDIGSKNFNQYTCIL